MRSRVHGRFLFKALFSGCLIAIAVSAWAQSAPQLVVQTVAVTDNRITITGKHFGEQSPAVTLADAPLLVVTSTDTEIVAEMSPQPAGLYVLVVTRAGDSTPEGSANSSVLIR